MARVLPSLSILLHRALSLLFFCLFYDFFHYLVRLARQKTMAGRMALITHVVDDPPVLYSQGAVWLSWVNYIEERVPILAFSLFWVE